MAALHSSPSDMTLATALPSPVGHTLLWAAATLFTIEVALSHLWPAPSRDQAMLMFGLCAAVLSLIPIVARLSVMEMTGRMEYSSMLGTAIFFAAVFMLPTAMVARKAPELVFPLGFIALSLPLVGLIVFPRRCHYLLADLLLIWICLLGIKPNISLVYPVVGLFLLTVATAVSHLHFRQVRNRRAVQNMTPAWAATIVLFGLSLGAALAINWVLPERWMEPAPVTGTPSGFAPPAPTSTNPRTVDPGELRRLFFEMGLVTVLSIVVIVMIGRIIRKLRSKRQPVPVEGFGEDFITEQFRISPPPRAERRTGSGIRDKIIATYLDTTDRMMRGGWVFPSHTTAEEFLHESEEQRFAGSDALRDLTVVFERAKYSETKMKPKDLKHSREMAKRVATAMTRDS